MSLLLLLLLQTAAPPADIELGVRVRARSLTVERQGKVTLAVRADPDAGSRVDAEATRTAGRKTVRNSRADVHAEVRLGDPSGPVENIASETETVPPQ